MWENEMSTFLIEHCIFISAVVQKRQTSALNESLSLYFSCSVCIRLIQHTCAGMWCGACGHFVFECRRFVIISVISLLFLSCKVKFKVRSVFQVAKDRLESPDDKCDRVCQRLVIVFFLQYTAPGICAITDSAVCMERERILYCKTLRLVLKLLKDLYLLYILYTF